MKTTRLASILRLRAVQALSLILIPMLALTACGSPATQPSARTDQPAAESGCAQPSPKVELTSKEFNMFTWSEYIPDEIVKCFEEVYGIKVNHDMFSSQGELLAKLSRGASGYDIVQPSDDMVQLMVQQNLFAELDHSKLTVMANFNPPSSTPPSTRITNTACPIKAARRASSTTLTL